MSSVVNSKTCVNVCATSRGRGGVEKFQRTKETLQNDI